MNNDQNYKNYKKRKWLRRFAITLALVTIVLAILSLFKLVSIIWALLTLVLANIILRVRAKIPYVPKEEKGVVKRGQKK